MNRDIVEVATKRFLLRQLTKDDISDKYLSWLKIEENPYIEYGKNHSTLEELKVYVSERKKKRDVLFLGIFTINKTHIDDIIKLNPNYMGFRGALCENNALRSSNISAQNVNDIIKLVRDYKIIPKSA